VNTKTSPDLINSGSNAAPIAVPPLAAGVQREPGSPLPTAPLPNNKVDTSRYYYCTVPTASMHRTDGKKLPFVNGLLKTDIEQDILFLDKEISEGNIYIRHATEDEVAHAKLIEDPMGAVREAVKAEVLGSFSVEELEKLLAERRAATSVTTDANKLAGTQVNQQASLALAAKGVNAAHTGTVGGATTASLAAMVAKK
jgi:hypothetical protein